MTDSIFYELLERYPILEPVKGDIYDAYILLRDTFSGGGKLLCCGNGGSCADCEHIVGELMKSFRVKRPIKGEIASALRADGGAFIADSLEGTLPAISLCGHPALSTAYLNDKAPLLTFAQQLYGLGKAGDALLAISTSGNSKNCLYAAQTARAMGISVIALTGESGGGLREIADITVAVDERETFKVQELHLPIYHALCAMLEDYFFAV